MIKKILILAIAAVLAITLLGCGNCEHQWQNGDCLSPRACALCGELEESAPGHELATSVTPPTCEGEGYTATYCKNCEYSEKSNTVAAHGHAYGDWVIEDPIMPDDAEGLKIARCVNCDGKKTASVGVITEGTLGSSVKYRVYEDGTLLVFGKGATADCSWNGSTQPYIQYRDFITRAVVGDGVTELVGGVFAYMPNLDEYQFPATLKKLTNNTFMDSFKKGITEFVFPESIQHIGICVIGPYKESNAKFTDVYIENPNATLVESNGYIPFNSYSASCKDLTVYSYGTTNKVRSFADARGIKYFDLQSTVKGKIGNLAYEFFDGTLTLSSANAAESTEIPQDFFDKAKIDKTKVELLKVTANVTEIPSACFKDCISLSEVSLPQSLLTIGSEAFATSSPCAKELKIDIKENLSSIAPDILKNRSGVSVSAYRNTAADGFSASGVKVTLRGSLKILLIGNSLSLDAADFLNDSRPSLLYDMIKSMTGDSTFVEIAVLYSGAKTAGWHATVAELDLDAYQFMVISDDTKGKWTGYNNYTAKQALCFDDWDIVTIQPYAAEAQTGVGANGDTDTNPEKTSPVKAQKFYPLDSSLPYLLDYINTYAKDAEVYYYLTWSTSYTAALNQNREGYDAMLAVAKKALEYKGSESQKGFEGLIPVGTAIQNARSTFLGLIKHTDPSGNTNFDQIGLLRDGLHLSVEIGRYIAALSFAEILVPTDLRQEEYTLPDVSSAALGAYADRYTDAAVLSVEKMLESLDKSGAEQYAPVEIAGYTVLP